jgi:predicted ATPase
VFGRHFTLDMPQAVTEMPEQALHSALERPVGADILVPEGKPPDVRYRFRHALLQEAAYESMLKSRRASYHHIIARHLLERSEADAGATATITYHLTRAGVTHEAVDSTAQTVGRSGPEE